MLAGCALPTAWAGQRQWRILETGFASGLNFLAAWRAWKDDPQRPGMLHFASVVARPVGAPDLVDSARPHPQLHELAQQLAAQWWGLLPGFHRLSFEDGRVLLTLCVGEVEDMLKQQAFQADCVFLEGCDSLPVIKAVSRLCRRGTRLAARSTTSELRRGLEQCGFQAQQVAWLPSGREELRAVFDPSWQPRGLVEIASVVPAHCVVIGAGLAGAAAAASLARRGWRVRVLDAAAAAASGASGLPAGLLAPHQSPDDNLLSRLSRAGVRATLQQAQWLLPGGDAWQMTGVLEHRLDDERPLPPLGAALQVWTREADETQKAQADLPEEAPAWWHEKAGWIRPQPLVRAWLQQPGIERAMRTRVRRLQPDGGRWRVLGDADEELASAELVIVAAAHDSAPLLQGRVALHPVRGQVSWSHAVPAAAPPYPLNGNGHFLPRVPLPGGDAWLAGATYGRGETQRDERAADHRANLQRLRRLVPQSAAALEAQFSDGTVQAWTGVRCASSDRRPLVGPLEPGLWVSTAMGSRGLTFAVLCAELLAARLHGEPLPLERKLAEALDVARALR